MNYSSTLEDANVTIVCEQNNNTDPTFTTAHCNAEGTWEPNPSGLCLNSGIHNVCVCACVFYVDGENYVYYTVYSVFA